MKVYFDENTSPYIASALNELEKSENKISVLHTKNEIGQGASDPVVVKHVSSHVGVLFSQDDDFKKSKILLNIMNKNPIGLFYFKQPKATKYWDLVQTYTKCWLHAREIILNKTTPYYYEIINGGKIKKRDHLVL